MAHPTVLSLFFGAGVIVQSLLLLRRDLNKNGGLTFIGVFALSAVLLLIFTRMLGDAGTLAGFIVAYFIIFSFVFTFFFKERILPEIDEGAVLVWTMITWYVYLTTFGNNWVISAILLIPSVATLALNFTRKKVSKTSRVLFYVWYLLMVIFITSSMYLFREINVFSPVNPFLKLSWVSLVFYGMVTMYMLSNLYYIVALIPIASTRRKGAWKEKIKSIKRHAKLLGSKYSENQSHYLFVIIVALLMLVGILLQYNCSWFDEFVFISLLLVISQFISLKNKSV